MWDFSVALITIHKTLRIINISIIYFSNITLHCLIEYQYDNVHNTLLDSTILYYAFVLQFLGDGVTWICVGLTRRCTCPHTRLPLIGKQLQWEVMFVNCLIDVQFRLHISATCTLIKKPCSFRMVSRSTVNQSTSVNQSLASQNASKDIHTFFHSTYFRIHGSKTVKLIKWWNEIEIVYVEVPGGLYIYSIAMNAIHDSWFMHVEVPGGFLEANELNIAIGHETWSIFHVHQFYFGIFQNMWK